MADGGGNTDLQSSPNINGQLRKAGVFMGPDYHKPNPWLEYWVGQMNLKLKIDGKKAKL